MVMAEDLWCKNCDIPLSLRDMIQGSERRHGLASEFSVLCRGCQSICKVHTGKKRPIAVSKNKKYPIYDMNCKLLIGCIDSSLGPNNLNSLLTSLNIPPASKSLLKRYERIVGPAIEKVAQDSCRESIAVEKALTLAASPDRQLVNADEASSRPTPMTPTSTNSLLHREQTPQRTPNRTQQRSPPLHRSGKVKIVGTLDCGWQKRGNGRSYNSLSAHLSMFGQRSGRCMGYGVKSKACAMCARGHPKSDHDCRKNHVGSAKSMEPQLAVEVVTRNPLLEEANVVIGTLVGDDDSCSIQAVRRESTVPVTKWLDLNHVRKGFSNAMYSLHLPEHIRTYMCKCFGYAVAQNKGDVDAMKASLTNIIHHAFGEHDSCGSWCKFSEDPLNYRHNGLPEGKPLTSRELRAQLTTVLSRYIANVDKIAPCASSQANESFNNLVATKNPKYKFNAGSEALPFRVAASVCQINKGTSYVMDVNLKSGLSPGNITKKYRTITDNYRQKRSIYQKTREYKSKRNLWKRMRSNKSAAEERSEGITYATGCELNGIADLIDDPQILAMQEEVSDDTCLVYFDLETTGLSKLTCEITQIAAKVMDKEYSAYIVPHRNISPTVTALTGLSSDAGELFLNGERVDTVPHRLALINLLDFLRSIASSVLLVSHNAMRFDAPIILRDFRKLGLLEDFMKVCPAFVDSLIVFREKLPGRESYRQTALAEEFGIMNPNAHNAVADVAVLERLVEETGVTKEDLVRHCKTITSVIQREDSLASKKTITESLKCLKPTVSASMISKIAAAGITLDKLQRTFQSGGADALSFLLSHDVNGKPKVTRMKKKLIEIKEAVDKSLQNK